MAFWNKYKHAINVISQQYTYDKHRFQNFYGNFLHNFTYNKSCEKFGRLKRFNIEVQIGDSQKSVVNAF